MLYFRYKDEDEETEAFLRNNVQVERLKKASLTHQQVLHFHEFFTECLQYRKHEAIAWPVEQDKDGN